MRTETEKKLIDELQGQRTFLEVLKNSFLEEKGKVTIDDMNSIDYQIKKIDAFFIQLIKTENLQKDSVILGKEEAAVILHALDEFIENGMLAEDIQYVLNGVSDEEKFKVMNDFILDMIPSIKTYFDKYHPLINEVNYLTIAVTYVKNINYKNQAP